jgi:GT2 family glycosyltransferase
MGDGMTDKAKIGAVVLTYNSQNELPTCLDGLLAQRGVDARIVVVDNASSPINRAKMEAIFLSKVPDGEIIDAVDATPTVLSEAKAIFVRNARNDGYSAGNNIGARLAVGLGCTAVLVVNPDVQIADPNYLATLWEEMRSVPGCLVGSSRVVNLQGSDEHPLREIGFWEDLLWMRQYGPRKTRPAPYVRPPYGTAPIEVEKLHGCCMLIRSSFLEKADFLDENVFLYCEEPILAARVRAAGGRLFVFPRMKAVHAHVASTKGNSSRRMLLFIKSRLYFFKTYTAYGPIRMAALRGSYGLLGMLHWLKAKFDPS